MNTSDVLIRARDLFASAPNKFNTAVDAHGVPVPSDSTIAVAWCAVGAIHRVCNENGIYAVPIVQAVARQLPTEFRDEKASPHTVADFNDHQLTRPSDVVAVFNKAIEAAE